MNKSALKLMFGSVLSTVIALQLFCLNFDSPSSPEKTNASVVFMSSMLKIYEGALVDSVGKEVRIGAALYLPANFDSVLLQVLDEQSTVVDTVFRTFKSEYYFDTLWVKHTFLKPGVKNVTITPFSTPERPSIGATITIQGIEIVPPDSTPPALSFVIPSDTNVTISADTFTIDLLCSDSSGVASVSAGMGQKTFQSTLKNGYYTIPITGFTRGEINVVTITAKDFSASGNPISQKLYFNYKGSTYSVKYSKGSGVSGDLPVDTRIYQSGEQAIVMGNTGNLTKNDFTFSGWNTKEDGSGTVYAGGSTFKMGNADVELFAQWTTNSVYKVVYNGNGNTGGTIPVDSNNYIASSTVTVKGNTGLLTKSSATFKGWNTTVDGSGTAYAGGVSFVIGSADVVLYAQWTTSTIYTVTYKGNGNTAGAVPLDNNNYETSAQVTVKDNTGSLVKPDATFIGWNTKADGSGIAYASGVTFLMGNSDVVLFAQWTTNPTFTVTYNGNGNTAGTVPVDVNKYETSATVTVKSNSGSLLKAGATLAGWNTAADGSGTSYDAGSTLMMGSANVILFAKWTQKQTFALTITATNGSVTKAPDLATYDSGIVVTLTPVPATGYHFAGWSGALTGTTNPATITMNSAKSVTAEFAKNQVNSFALTVLATNGTVKKTPDLPQYDSGSTVGLKATPSTGFSFVNWSGDATGTADSMSVVMSAAKNITANFAPVTYQLTVTTGTDGTIIAPITSQVSVNHGAKTTITASPNSGFKFNGWLVTLGTATIDDPGSASTSVTLSSGNATVSASYTRITYQLTVNGGSNGTISTPSSPTTVNHGTKTTITASPNSGFRFSGWSVTTGAATLDDPSLASTSVILTSDNATISAVFVRITYQLILTTETGGTISTPSSPATVNHGAATTVTASPGAGYNFNGWVVVTGSAAIPDLSLATTTVTLTSGNVEIKAQWTAIPYSITYTLNGGLQNGGSYPSTYTVNTSTITLPDPAKTAYVFDGWYDNSGLSGSKVTSIPKGTTGNKTLYAKWAIKDKDGNYYTEVKIGNQYWMVENFRCTKYNDGTAIPNVTDSAQWTGLSTGAYCFYDNSTNTAFREKFGALYNGYAVATGKLAPEGWRVPTDNDWTTLQDYLIANGYNYDGTRDSNKVAKALAAKTDWASSTGVGAIGNDLSQNNRSGFSALPGGQCRGLKIGKV
jgi:uncharacterized protein (TIGR02145 family)/uncharacterized repeat protein (TIGR02543 family)